MENKNVSKTGGMGEETMRISPSARKLAERYGVAPEVMEEIISDTRNQTSARTVAPPVVPIVLAPVVAPIVPQIVPPVVLAPATPLPPVPPVSPLPPAQPIVNNVVTMPPVEPKPIVTKPSDGEHGMSVGAVILGILLILALVLFFYFRPWSEVIQTRQIDTVRVMMPPAPKDTALAEVLPTMDTVDHSKDQLPPPKSHHRARHRAKQHYYTTSSGLQAQERLADLKATGNTSAYLETVQKGDNTYYRLHPTRKRR